MTTRSRSHCCPLEDPTAGILHIRMITSATTPPPDFTTQTLQDFSLCFHFNPLRELASPENALSFFSAKLAASFGVASELRIRIAFQMTEKVCNFYRLHGLCGLSVLTVLETIHVVEQRRLSPPVEFLDGCLILTDPTGFESIPRVGMSYRKIPILKKEQFQGAEEGECCICLEEFREGTIISRLPVCSHKFHNACIIKWLHKNQTCPICRTSQH